MTDIWLSSVQKHIWNNALSVYCGKGNPINGILTQNWFKDSILGNIGVSSDDWDHHSSSNWRGDIEKWLQTCGLLQFKQVLNNALLVSYGRSKTRNIILKKNCFKDSIIDDIGVSGDYWYYHSSFRLRINV